MTCFDVLKNDISINDKQIVLNKQLDEKIYAQIKRIFTSFRGKWVGGLTQAFSFPCDPTNFISYVLAEKRIPEINPHSYHPTPKEATETIFAHTAADPHRWAIKSEVRPIRILEPSAGEGALADEITKAFTKAGITFELTCIEIDPLNLLTLESKGYQPYKGDFLKYEAEQEFDLIVMNPPFVMLVCLYDYKCCFFMIVYYDLYMGSISAWLANGGHQKAYWS